MARQLTIQDYLKYHQYDKYRQYDEMADRWAAKADKIRKRTQNK